MQGPGQHSPLGGGFTTLSHLCTQSCVHLMGPGAAGRGIPGSERFHTELEGSPWDKSSTEGRGFSALPNGVVHDGPLETFYQLCPNGSSQSSQILPNPGMLLLAGHQGLISGHSSTARAALEACVAQEVQGSESWTGPNPDGERWPREWRK